MYGAEDVWEARGREIITKKITANKTIYALIQSTKKGNNIKTWRKKHGVGKTLGNRLEYNTIGQKTVSCKMWCNGEGL